MKKIVTLATLLICMCTLAYSKDLSKNKDLNYVFDLSSLPELRLEVSKAEWNKLLADFDKNSKNENYVKSEVIFIKNGKKETLKNVGLRLRGNVFSKFKPENAKTHDAQDPHWYPSHFRLDFDQFSQKQDFHGFKSLNLKAFNGDPALVREIYSLDLFQRMGVYTAQRSSYVRLTIHVQGDKQPAYFGIYRMLETIDQKYLNKRFAKDQEHGFLWKCLFPADLTLRDPLSRIGMEDPDKGLSYAYDLKTRQKDFKLARDQFTNFLQALNTKTEKDFENWVSNAIDVDLLLRAQAVNVMLGMWDDYWINNNNYYLYFDDKGKCFFIPYDYDNTLGTSGMGNVGLQDVFRWGALDGSRPLVSKILAIPRYKAQYSNYIAELIDPKKDLFYVTASTNRIQKWQDMIAPYTANDTGQFTRIEDKPANWGNNSYYRLLSGDQYGGPLPANYFLTRTESALVSLGLKKALEPADIDLHITGLDQHPDKGYLITWQDQNTITLELKSPHKITNLTLRGMVNTNLSNPPAKIQLSFDMSNKKLLDPVSPDWIPRGLIEVTAINDQNRGIREMVAVFRFDHSVVSPEIKGDEVIFRFKYAGDKPVELQGNFNEWGKKKTPLTKVSADIWEVRLKKSAIKPVPSNGDPANLVRYGFLIQDTTPIWSPDHANVNSRRGSSYFTLN